MGRSDTGGGDGEGGVILVEVMGRSDTGGGNGELVEVMGGVILVEVMGNWWR